MSPFNAVIIGSGPAGVSAAFPLLDAGLKVLMLDPGYSATISLSDASYHSLRFEKKDQWKFFIGPEFEAFRTTEDASPKFRIPSYKYVFADYGRRYGIEGRGFRVEGSLATGGLSNAWGAGVASFGAEDLGDFPFSSDALAESYKRVAERVGISGVAGDALSDYLGTNLPLQPPPALTPGAASLLTALKKQNTSTGEFRLGQSRNAILTKDNDGRRSCILQAMCLWGCSRGSIYSATHDLEKLKRYPRFKHQPGIFIESIGSTDARCFASGKRLADNSTFHIEAAKLILACGAIGTAKLVLGALSAFDVKVRVLSTPTAGFALFLPRQLGGTTPQEAFGSSQLSFTLAREGSYTFGNLFATVGLPAAEFIRRAPFSCAAGRALFRLLMPAMLVGNCFLPGSMSRNEMCLRRDGTLLITGGWMPELERTIAALRRRLAREFRKLGAILLPGSFSLTAPGSDVHYAGTVPMRAMPRAGEAFASGAVAGLSRVYVVDGAALPSLPAKAHTLTIMANADRIARGILL